MTDGAMPPEAGRAEPPRPEWRGRVAIVISLGARLILAAVFVGLGIHKILHPIDFLKVLREYQLLPEAPPQLMNLTVVVLPWLEVLCGLLILAGCWLRVAGTLVLTMTVLFTAAVTIRALGIYGEGQLGLCAIRFDCGCGQGEVLFCRKFLENTGLIVLAVWVTRSRSPACRLGNLLARGDRPG